MKKTVIGKPGNRLRQRPGLNLKDVNGKYVFFRAMMNQDKFRERGCSCQMG